MAVTISLYNGLADVLTAGVLDLDNSTAVVKLALVDAYTFSAAHDEWKTGEDPCDKQITGTNYVAGGTAVANLSVTMSTAQAIVDGDNVTWSTLTSSMTDNHITGAVLYVDEFTSGGETTFVNSAGATITKPLLAYVDFGGDQVVVAEDFTVTFAATGILQVG